jgi:hypothetical protein
MTMIIPHTHYMYMYKTLLGKFFRYMYAEYQLHCCMQHRKLGHIIHTAER